VVVRQYLNRNLVYLKVGIYLNRLTNANDCKTLVHEDGSLTDIASRPVRAAMTLFLGERDKSGPVSSRFWEAMYGEYATHFGGLGDLLKI
jgi:hypothetical protein